MKKDVPFVPNTPDDLHCVQSAYMMIAKYFQPSFSISMDEWSKLTGFEEGKGTWANTALLWFKENGYKVRHLSLFDYKAFVENPEVYILNLAGKEVGQWQIEHTNIPAEVERVKRLLEAGIIEQREPTFQDIKQGLDGGWLVRVMINWKKLAGKPGFLGHAVTIIGYEADSVIFHDPGAPPAEGRKVPFKEFEAAWADPNPSAKEFDAIKL